MKKSIITTTFLAGLLLNSALVFATTVGEDKKVEIEGTIEPYEGLSNPMEDQPQQLINLTLPSKISFNIDPNNAEGNYFTSSDFLISNDSTVPLKVSVESFQSVQKEGTYQFTDVLPSAHANWLDLTEEETMRDFAIGVKVVDPTQWAGNVRTEPVWAKEIQDAGTSIELGSIPASSQNVALTLEAKHGLKFSKWIKPAYDLTLYFEFAN